MIKGGGPAGVASVDEGRGQRSGEPAPNTTADAPMPASACFDYNVLDVDVAAEAKAAAARIKERTHVAVIDVGVELLRIKDRLPGQFGKWLKAEFAWSERSAQNYMRAAAWAAKSATVADLRPGTLYLITSNSTPESARQEIIERLEAGVVPDDVEVKKIIGAAKDRQAREKREADEAEREARVSPGARRYRQQREAKEARERQEYEARVSANSDIANSIAQLFLSRLQPGDRERLSDLFGAAAGFTYDYHQFKDELATALTRGVEDPAPEGKYEAVKEVGAAETEAVITDAVTDVGVVTDSAIATPVEAAAEEPVADLDKAADELRPPEPVAPLEVMAAITDPVAAATRAGGDLSCRILASGRKEAPTSAEINQAVAAAGLVDLSFELSTSVYRACKAEAHRVWSEGRGVAR